MAAAAITAGVVLSVLSTGARAQPGAIIGDGNLILGVGEAGYLNVPYERTLGLPSDDPADIGFVGLRSPDGRTTAVERGCLCEGWGAGIRDGDGTYLDECGAENNFLTNINVDEFRGTSGEDTASSAVMCGEEEVLWVRHDFRSARGRPGCRGAYEIKVSIENLACRPVRDVIYRRVLDWDIDPSPFNEFVTIRGTGVDPFFDDASNNGFCSMPPSFDCSPIEGASSGDLEAFGPTDHGTHMQINVGELREGERAIFRMFYGLFDSERDALECVDGANMNLYSLGQDDEKRNTFLFGFRRALSKVTLDNRDRDRCIDFEGRPRGRSVSEAMAPAADDAFAAAAIADGFMSEDEKKAMNS